MVYRYTKCPYCKFSLETGNTAPAHEVGPGHLPCPKCRKLYLTGKKLWKDMSEFEKNAFLVKKQIHSILRGAIFSIIPVAFLMSAETPAYVWVIVTLGIVYLVFTRDMKVIKKITTTDFNDFLSWYWSQYKRDYEKIIQKANSLAKQKGYEDFYKMEKSLISKHGPQLNDLKYYPLDERTELALKLFELNLSGFEEDGQHLNRDIKVMSDSEADNLSAELKKYKKLLDDNLISKSEFNAIKKRLLKL